MNALVDTSARTDNTDNGPVTYLLDGEGTMSVRVRPGLVLGEDADHRLLMAPGSAENNLLEFVADRNGALSMRAMGIYVLMNGTVEVQELAVIPATMLHLPHNGLYLSSTQSRGEIRHHVRVKRLDVVPDSRGRKRKRPAAAPRRKPAASAAVKAQAQPVPLTAPARRPGAPARRDAGSARSKLRVVNSYALAFGAFALVAALTAGLLWWQLASEPAARPLASSTTSVPAADPVGPTTVAAEREPAQPSAELPVPAILTVADMPPAAEEIPQDAAALPAVAAVEIAPSSDSLSIEQRLVAARERLQQGMVIWPQRDSAVDWIEGVLALEPQHPRALEMLDAAAKMLVTIAADAYEQGFRYDARNLLEEVLRFNPQYKDAQSLWAEWVTRSDAGDRDASRIRGNELAGPAGG